MTQPYYFAFDALLHRDTQQQWLSRLNRPTSALPDPIPAWCPDHEPVYGDTNPSRRGGLLALRRVPGQLTAGALLEWDTAMLQALAGAEAVSKDHTLQEITVLTADGRQDQAVTFIPAEPVLRHSPPLAAEHRLVIQAQRALGHDPEPFEQAATGATVSPAVNALFVYGTLMQGESRAHCLSQHGIRQRCFGRIPGRLLDLGHFPGLRPAARADQWVWGEWLVFDDIQGALEAADQIEGFGGFGNTSNFYDRRLTQVTLADGSQALAWVYYFGEETGAPLPQGHWSPGLTQVTLADGSQALAWVYYFGEETGAPLPQGHWSPGLTQRSQPDPEPFIPCQAFDFAAFDAQVARLERATRRLTDRDCANPTTRPGLRCRQRRCSRC